RLILRIVCDDSSALYKLNYQFGASLHDTRHLLTVARQLNLDVIGVSFHVGGGCPEVDAWSVAISNAKRVFEEGAEIGFSFSLLDIGGGFPGEPTAHIHFDDICDAVSVALEEHFPADSRVRVIAEPGRYMVGSALTLVVNVIAKRTVFCGNDETGTKEAENMLYVNDGVFGSFFIRKLYNDVPFPTLLEAVEDEGKEKCRTSIWGPTCAGLDCILADVMMPDVDVGSWLAFENMGAYGVVVAPGFNGFPKPSLYLASDPEKPRRLSEVVKKEKEEKEKEERGTAVQEHPSH
ncbi:PREDICTED: ornithine decarboxylase-like, partial [Priapulus caudatus]|uniref:Ornithine decarboxylase-like n=1 Tax=Priapulus caudatus TaxID=37621 RepID=A0ABM1EG19_PRICU